MIINTDLHLHSNISIDANNSIEEMCIASIEKGMKYICFTEHYDLNPRDEGYNFFNYDKYSDEIKYACDKFGNEITILKGIEFSEPHLYPKEFEDIQNLEFDMILGSIHWINEYFVGESKLQKEYSIIDIWNIYYEEIYKMINYGGIDAVAHFDFPKRYLKENNVNSINTEIFEQIVNKDIILEINSSSLRKGVEETMPGQKIVDMYITAGGKSVIIGSDSHSISEIASDFYQIEKILTSSNLNYGFIEKHKFNVI